MILYRGKLAYHEIEGDMFALNTEDRNASIPLDALGPVISSKSFILGEGLPSKGCQISVKSRECAQSRKQVFHPTQRDWQLASGEGWAIRLVYYLRQRSATGDFCGRGKRPDLQI